MTFSHTGDYGDIIACLPIIREMGGGELVIGINPEIPVRQVITFDRYLWLAGLIQGQDYITGTRFSSTPPEADIHFEHFRNISPLDKFENLTNWMSRGIGGSGNVDTSPWLKVQPSSRRSRVVVARSGRYEGPMNWREQLEANLKENEVAGFIGMPDEKEHLEYKAGHVLKYIQVGDAYDMAQVINESELFIGNQSFPCWLALGLGVNLIQEVSLYHPNSQIIRDNCTYI